MLEYLTKNDFLKMYKDKQEDFNDQMNFLNATVNYMSENIAVNADEISFCCEFFRLVRKNSSLHRLSDKLTLR